MPHETNYDITTIHDLLGGLVPRGRKIASIVRQYVSQRAVLIGYYPGGNSDSKEHSDEVALEVFQEALRLGYIEPVVIKKCRFANDYIISPAGRTFLTKHQEEILQNLTPRAARVRAD